MIFCDLFRPCFPASREGEMNKPAQGFPRAGFLSNYITYETQNSP